MKRKYPICTILVALLLSTIVLGNSTKKSKPSQASDIKNEKSTLKHTGKFEVKGTILNADSTPLAGKKVYIMEVTKDGEVKVWVDEKGVHDSNVANGKTDDQGKFRIKVSRANFARDTILFSLCLESERWKNVPDLDTILKHKSGAIITIEIDETTKLFDMDKYFGSIMVKDNGLISTHSHSEPR